MRIQLQSKPDYALLVYGATTLKIDNFSQFDGYVDTSPTQAAALTGAGVKWTRFERRGAVKDRRVFPELCYQGPFLRRIVRPVGRRRGDRMTEDRRLARSARRVIPYGRRHTQFSFAGADRRGIDMLAHVGRRGEPCNGRRKGDRVPENRRSGGLRRVNTATARAISHRGISTRTTFGRRGRDQREKVY